VPGAEVAPARVAGLYGKLPARGDFVSRRLDSQFIEAWDAWLQRALSASREALGPRWLECFLSAPVWRFLVPAGMFSATGWVGLIVPSVDRVGRYFPLTIAAPVPEDGIDAPSSLSNALGWLDSIEALALEALAPELDFDAFDRRLAELTPPADLAVVSSVSDDTVPLGGTRALFQVWPFAPEVADARLREFLQHGALGSRASAAAWMTRGGEAFAPSIALCGGLIPGGHFCAMLDGRWTEHAWNLIPEAAPAATADIANVMYCPPLSPGVDLVHGQGRGEAGETKRGEAGPLTATQSSEQQ
jgi:type VI secretion system protein ImpM